MTFLCPELAPTAKSTCSGNKNKCPKVFSLRHNLVASSIAADECRHFDKYTNAT